MDSRARACIWVYGLRIGDWWGKEITQKYLQMYRNFFFGEEGWAANGRSTLKSYYLSCQSTFETAQATRITMWEARIAPPKLIGF